MTYPIQRPESSKEIQIPVSNGINQGATYPISRTQTQSSEPSASDQVIIIPAMSSQAPKSRSYSNFKADMRAGLGPGFTPSAGNLYDAVLALLERGTDITIVGDGTNSITIGSSGSQRSRSDTIDLLVGDTGGDINFTRNGSGGSSDLRGTIRDTAVDSDQINPGAIDLAHLSATGTKDTTTFLRGDNTFAVPPASTAGGGEMNVQSDWTETDTTDDSYIQNKPTLAPSNAEQNVQSDWTESTNTSDAFIQNKPTIPAKGSAVPIDVGTSGKVVGDDTGWSAGNHVHQLSAAVIARLVPTPASANRSKWIQRNASDEGFSYVDAPAGGTARSRQDTIDLLIGDTGGDINFTRDGSGDSSDLRGTIRAGAVGSNELGSGVVNSAKLANDAVVNAAIATDAVETSNIKDANVTQAKLADDSVGLDELSATGTPSATNYLRGDNSWGTPAGTGTGWTYDPQSLIDDIDDDTGGDIDFSRQGSGATSNIRGTIRAGSVGSTELATDAVTTIKITDANVTAAKLATDSVTNVKVADDAIDSDEIVDGAIDLAHLSATGTKDATTFLRGDNTFATPPGSGTGGPRVTVSSAAPSGGTDGDIWFRISQTSGNLADVISIQGRVAGTWAELDDIVPVSQNNVYEEVKNILQAGTNVTFTEDDTNDQLSITASGGGAGGTGDLVLTKVGATLSINGTSVAGPALTDLSDTILFSLEYDRDPDDDIKMSGIVRKGELDGLPFQFQGAGSAHMDVTVSSGNLVFDNSDAGSVHNIELEIYNITAEAGPKGDKGDPGVGSTIIVEDEGTALTTAAATLDFVGDGVTASGTGATKTITIPGSSGGGSVTYLQPTINFQRANTDSTLAGYNTFSGLGTATTALEAITSPSAGDHVVALIEISAFIHVVTWVYSQDSVDTWWRVGAPHNTGVLPNDPVGNLSFYSSSSEFNRQGFNFGSVDWEASQNYPHYFQYNVPESARDGAIDTIFSGNFGDNVGEGDFVLMEGTFDWGTQVQTPELHLTDSAGTTISSSLTGRAIDASETKQYYIFPITANATDATVNLVATYRTNSRVTSYIRLTMEGFAVFRGTSLGVVYAAMAAEGWIIPAMADPSWRGLFEVGEHYNRDDVILVGSRLYRCNTTGTTQNPSDSGNGWTLMTPSVRPEFQGDWGNTNAYSLGQYVYHDSTFWFNPLENSEQDEPGSAGSSWIEVGGQDVNVAIIPPETLTMANVTVPAQSSSTYSYVRLAATASGVTDDEIIISHDTTNRNAFTIKQGRYIVHAEMDAASSNQRFTPELHIRTTDTTPEMKCVTTTEYFRSTGRASVRLFGYLDLDADDELRLDLTQDNYGSSPTPATAGTATAVSGIKIVFIPVGGVKGDKGDPGSVNLGNELPVASSSAAASGLSSLASRQDHRHPTPSIPWNSITGKPSFAPSTAEVNVQADWNETSSSSDAFIRNKPTLAPSEAEANVQADWNETSSSSDAFIQNKPTIPTNSGEANVQADWTETDTTDDSFIQNKPTLAPSGAEANVQADWNESSNTNDAFIKNKPTIPTPIAINDRGIWTAPRDYAVNDLVRQDTNGIVAICHTAHTSQSGASIDSPASPGQTKWTIIVHLRMGATIDGQIKYALDGDLNNSASSYIPGFMFLRGSFATGQSSDTYYATGNVVKLNSTGERYVCIVSHTQDTPVTLPETGTAWQSYWHRW